LLLSSFHGTFLILTVTKQGFFFPQFCDINIFFQFFWKHHSNLHHGKKNSTIFSIFLWRKKQNLSRKKKSFAKLISWNIFLF
jgi:hypothetical protein